MFPSRSEAIRRGMNLILKELQTRQHVENVLVVCGKCNRPTRLNRKRLEDGKPARSCKRCGEMIGKL